MHWFTFTLIFIGACTLAKWTMDLIDRIEHPRRKERRRR